MRRFVPVFAIAMLMAPMSQAAEMLVVKQSPYSVSKTLDRLSAVMEKKGITIFARVDHGAGAKRAGMELKPTEVLIFGNPALGTPLMQVNPLIGVDLPLKALAWEDRKGKVWLGYTSPAVLKARFEISGKDAIFDKMTGALDKLTGAAVKTE